VLDKLLELLQRQQLSIMQ